MISVRYLSLPWILLFEKSWLCWPQLCGYIYYRCFEASRIYVSACNFMAPCYVRMPFLQIRAVATHVIISIVDMLLEIFFSKEFLQQETWKIVSVCLLPLRGISRICLLLYSSFPCTFYAASLFLFCRWAVLNSHLFSTCWAINKVITCGLVTQSTLQQQIRVF